MKHRDLLEATQGLDFIGSLAVVVFFFLHCGTHLSRWGLLSAVLLRQRCMGQSVASVGHKDLEVLSIGVEDLLVV